MSKHKNWKEISGHVDVVIYQIGSDIVTERYATLRDALLRYYFHTAHKKPHPTEKILDEVGMQIPQAILDQHYDKLRAEYIEKHLYSGPVWRRGWDNYDFRDGPVPYTGKGPKWGYYKNHSKRFRNYLGARFTDDQYVDDMAEEYNVYIKNRKGFRYNPWHDGNKRPVQKNWKKFRKTQYK